MFGRLNYRGINATATLIMSLRDRFSIRLQCDLLWQPSLTTLVDFVRREATTDGSPALQNPGCIC